jgi:hypothetical protein
MKKFGYVLLFGLFVYGAAVLAGEKFNGKQIREKQWGKKRCKRAKNAGLRALKEKQKSPEARHRKFKKK